MNREKETNRKQATNYKILLNFLTIFEFSKDCTGRPQTCVSKNIDDPAYYVTRAFNKTALRCTRKNDKFFANSNKKLLVGI